MRLVESGRLVFPETARAAREYARENLVSIHSRAGRLGAIVGHAPMDGAVRDENDLSPFSLAMEKDEALEMVRTVSAELSPTEDWLLLRDYSKNSRARSILFTFRDGELTTVVKLRDVRGKGRALRNESTILRHVQSSFSETVRPTVPAVLDYGETATHEVLVLSPVAGRPLWISMQRSLRPVSSHARHLARAGSWLGEFQREAALMRTESGDAQNARVERVVVHGDLWARNILFERGRFAGVVDWERASLDGEPWHDLFTLPLLFVTDEPSWSGGSRLERFERAFIRSSRHATVVKSFFDAYLERSRIDGSMLRPMFEEFLAAGEDDAGKEEQGWRRDMPWPAMRERFLAAGRTVFSG